MDVMHDGLPVATARQTNVGLYATAREAHDMWKADPQDVRLLDVRSPEEYVFIGHAPMARLIPMAVPTYAWDATGTTLPWAPNPDFVPTVQKWAEPGDTILVTCRSGDAPPWQSTPWPPPGSPACTTCSTAWKEAPSTIRRACSTACE